MNNKKLYESIMRNVAKEVKKVLNENVKRNVYENIHMNTKCVFVGDVCYALDKDIYYKVWRDKLNFVDGIVSDLNNTYAVVGFTAFGVGLYYDDNNNAFPVDAGVIGVTDLNWIRTDTSIEDLESLGIVIDIPSEQADIIFNCEDGIFNITIIDSASNKTLYCGIINTDDYDDYEEDEMYESLKNRNNVNETLSIKDNATLCESIVDVYERTIQICDEIGYDTYIDDLYQIMSTDETKEMIEYFEKNYDFDTWRSHDIYDNWDEFMEWWEDTHEKNASEEFVDKIILNYFSTSQLQYYNDEISKDYDLDYFENEDDDIDECLNESKKVRKKKSKKKNNNPTNLLYPAQYLIPYLSILPYYRPIHHHMPRPLPPRPLPGPGPKSMCPAPHIPMH